MRFIAVQLAKAGVIAGLLGASMLAQAASPSSTSSATPATSASPAAGVKPATATAAAPAGSASDLAPILGMLEIGNPLPALPDCADKRTPDGRDVTAFCVELLGDGVMRQIGVPRDKRPAFMDGFHALAFVDRNALVGLIVPTDGIRSEQAAVKSLSAAFGKPFRQEKVGLQDKGGKTVDTIHAGWLKKPLTVELYAMPDDPDTGSIELLLPRARALMAQKDADVAQQLNPAPASAAKAAPSASKPAQQKGKAGNW